MGYIRRIAITILMGWLCFESVGTAWGGPLLEVQDGGRSSAGGCSTISAPTSPTADSDWEKGEIEKDEADAKSVPFYKNIKDGGFDVNPAKDFIPRDTSKLESFALACTASKACGNNNGCLDAWRLTTLAHMAMVGTNNLVKKAASACDGDSCPVNLPAPDPSKPTIGSQLDQQKIAQNEQILADLKEGNTTLQDYIDQLTTLVNDMDDEDAAMVKGRKRVASEKKDYDNQITAVNTANHQLANARSARVAGGSSAVASAQQAVDVQQALLNKKKAILDQDIRSLCGSVVSEQKFQSLAADYHGEHQITLDRLKITLLKLTAQSDRNKTTADAVDCQTQVIKVNVEKSVSYSGISFNPDQSQNQMAPPDSKQGSGDSSVTKQADVTHSDSGDKGAVNNPTTGASTQTPTPSSGTSAPSPIDPAVASAAVPLAANLANKNSSTTDPVVTPPTPYTNRQDTEQPLDSTHSDNQASASSSSGTGTNPTPQSPANTTAAGGVSGGILAEATGSEKKNSSGASVFTGSSLKDSLRDRLAGAGNGSDPATGKTQDMGPLGGGSAGGGAAAKGAGQNGHGNALGSIPEAGGAPVALAGSETDSSVKDIMSNIQSMFHIGDSSDDGRKSLNPENPGGSRGIATLADMAAFRKEVAPEDSAPLFERVHLSIHHCLDKGCVISNLQNKL